MTAANGSRADGSRKNASCSYRRIALWGILSAVGGCGGQLTTSTAPSEVLIGSGPAGEQAQTTLGVARWSLYADRTARTSSTIGVSSRGVTVVELRSSQSGDTVFKTSVVAADGQRTVRDDLVVSSSGEVTNLVGADKDGATDRLSLVVTDTLNIPRSEPAPSAGGVQSSSVCNEGCGPYCGSFNRDCCWAWSVEGNFCRAALIGCGSLLLPGGLLRAGIKSASCIAAAYNCRNAVINEQNICAYPPYSCQHLGQGCGENSECCSFNCSPGHYCQ